VGGQIIQAVQHPCLATAGTSGSEGKGRRGGGGHGGDPTHHPKGCLLTWKDDPVVEPKEQGPIAAKGLVEGKVGGAKGRIQGRQGGTGDLPQCTPLSHTGLPNYGVRQGGTEDLGHGRQGNGVFVI
jgi:hypothetical protein